MPSISALTFRCRQRCRDPPRNGRSSAPGSCAARAPSACRHPPTHFGANSQQSQTGLTRTPQSVLALQFADSDCAAWARSIPFEGQPRPCTQPTTILTDAYVEARPLLLELAGYPCRRRSTDADLQAVASKEARSLSMSTPPRHQGARAIHLCLARRTLGDHTE